MEAYDLSHKLAYAGKHSPIPFTTGPEYTNSVPGVPVLSMLRIFIAPDLWTEENVKTAAREVARVLGSTAQFDIGMTLSGTAVYDADRPASGDTARLMKLDPQDTRVLLRLRGNTGDKTLEARFPRLQFEQTGEDFWRSLYATGAVKEPTQP